MTAASPRPDLPVLVSGAGIGGLALALHRAGIPCRVYEAAAEILPLGVGINVLPHATAELQNLGVLEALERVAVVTREAAFFNRFYPIRNDVDAGGRQLVNGVAELEGAEPVRRDWTAGGRLDDFFPAFRDWHFDWLDVARLIPETPSVLAAGGAGRRPAALTRYDEVRNAATAKVVLTNRTHPPDAILREVHERSGDRPFERIEDAVPPEDLARIADHYKQVAGMRPAAADHETGGRP